MADLLEKLNTINQMILNGQALEAFDQYYHEDVVMQENDHPPRVGKAANRVHEQSFFDSITEFRGAEVLAVAVGENTTMAEWHFDYVHKDWGEKKYNQVAVQKWKDGQIVHERFYYGS